MPVKDTSEKRARAKDAGKWSHSQTGLETFCFKLARYFPPHTLMTMTRPLFTVS